MLFKINKKSASTRRDFLTSAALFSLAGCADNKLELIHPHFKDPEYAIPGNSVYYATLCTECQAGCGLLAETKEGRVIKVEGNPDHPINKGKTCALGQSLPQAHYDPNRVREPIEKTQLNDSKGNPVFSFIPLQLNDALSKFATKIKNASKILWISKELDSFSSFYVQEFCKKFNINFITYEFFNYEHVQKACKRVFDVDALPEYDLSSADIIVSFGAEFLEYWLNPVKFSRDWAFRRKNAQVFHCQIEPRQTLTGAKADLWLCIKPHTEIYFALALLKAIQKLKNSPLPVEILSYLNKLEIEDLISKTDIPSHFLHSLANKLVMASSPVVLGGGVQARGEHAETLEVVCLLINYCLEAVGKTIDFSSGVKCSSDFASLDKALSEFDFSDPKAVLILSGNIEPWLPTRLSISEKAKQKQASIIGFFEILNTTAKLCDLILPVDNCLETFSAHVRGGLVTLGQPAMLRLYKSRHISEYLTAVQNALLNNQDSNVDVYNLFENYLRKSFNLNSQEIKKAQEVGFFPLAKSKIKPKLAIKSFSIGAAKDLDDAKLKLLPLGTVKAWDGRGENRGWLHELHDPISLVSWDCWIELHPKTAKKLRLKNKDYVKLYNSSGYIEGIVVINPLMKPGTVGVPLGITSGEESLSFAKIVKWANANKLFDLKESSLLASSFKIEKTTPRKQVYQTQVTTDEHGRDLIKVKVLKSDYSELKSEVKDEKHHHHGVNLYEQRKKPMFKWGLSVDLAICTGCSACVVACYAENNIPVVGPRIVAQGRRMSWITIHQYTKNLPDNSVRRVFVPLMCQQCGNAPCEPVCPVYATYHNEEGLNAMIYNRCVGTRYCANNCVYKVRRFNWFEYEFPDSLKLQLNPDVTKRGVGVMEKCNFCIQRINEVKFRAKKEGRLPRDGEIQTACQQSCPTGAIVFGNLLDESSLVSQTVKSERGWKLLDDMVNTQPAVTYLADLKFQT